MYNTHSINSDTGKPIYKIIPSDRFKRLRKDFASDRDFDLYVQADPDLIAVPCKKCLGCRLDYSREWACRCMLELKENPNAVFVTWTYDDNCIMEDDGEEENLIHPSFADYGKAKILRRDKNGLPVLSLRKDSFSRMVKRYRKEFEPDSVRFFGCGEYGSSGFSPHYHSIMYGPAVDDLVPVGKNALGDTYYSSSRISRIWPYGYVTIGNVSFQSCAYVARYTAKKSCTLGADFYEKHNLEIPFVLMSRRPGIGKAYLDKHPEIFETDHIYLPKRDSVSSFRLPDYYFRQLEKSNPDEYEAIKQRRKENGNVYQKALILTSQKSYEKTMQDAEYILQEKAKSLDRLF